MKILMDSWKYDPITLWCHEKDIISPGELFLEIYKSCRVIIFDKGNLRNRCIMDRLFKLKSTYYVYTLSNNKSSVYLKYESIHKFLFIFIFTR